MEPNDLEHTQSTFSGDLDLNLGDPVIPANFSGPAAQVLLQGATLGRAFVATGSQSRLIFATLAETQGVPFVTVYCGARNYQGQDGILISMYMQNAQPNALVVLTLMQDGAQTYAAPVPYTGG